MITFDYEQPEPFALRATKVVVIAAVHVAALMWLYGQQIVAAGEVVLMTMDVRFLQETPIEPPKPPPQKPKPAPAVTTPPPVLAAAPDSRPAVSGFAVAPQPPAPPREVPANVTTAPTAPPVVAAPPPPPEPLPVTAARFDADYLNNPPPVYPAISRRMREEGQVLLLVHVSPEGAVLAVHVRQGSGFARLDDAALAAVREWRFVPARRGQKAIASTVVVPIVFTLKPV